MDGSGPLAASHRLYTALSLAFLAPLAAAALTAPVSAQTVVEKVPDDLSRLETSTTDEFVELVEWPPTPKVVPEQEMPGLAPAFTAPPAQRPDGDATYGERRPFKGNFADNWSLLNTDAYHQLGMPIGAFVLYPALEIGGVFTDNIRQAKSDRKADIGLRLRPEFDLRSDWQRHELQIRAQSEHVLYADESRQDVDRADIQARLRLDIRHDLSALVEGGYVLSQEGLAEADMPVNATEPRKDQTWSLHAGVTNTAGRIGATLRGGLSWHEAGNVKLSDGTVENNRDLSYVEPLAELRLRYQDAPVLVPFMEAAFVPRLYEHADDVLGVKRSSDGLRLAIGAEIERDALWSGSLALTYELRDYRHMDRKVDGFGFRANLLWRPTRITAVALDASSSIAETDVVGATAAREYVLGARVQHALRYNLLAAVNARYSLADYIGVKLEEQTWRLGLDMSYFLTPRLALIGGYEFIDYHVTGGGRDYTENRIMAGIRLQR